MFTLLLKLRGNIVVQFSLASFVLMAALAITIAVIYTNKLAENIELLSRHGSVMHSGDMIRSSDPFSIPSMVDDVNRLRWLTLTTIIVGFAMLYSSLVAMVWNAWNTIKSQRIALYERVRELESASVEITQLQGMIPICAHCKNVREDDGYWGRIETYLGKRTDAEFSHSICPTCLSAHYPEVAERLVGNLPPDVSESPYIQVPNS